MAVAEHLKQVNPPVWNQITDTMRVVDISLNEDQAEAFKRGITRGNASEGMAIAHRLSQTSYNDDGSVNMTPEDKVAYLASLPPDQLENTLNQARQFLEMEHAISRRYAEQYAQMPKRRTAAPAPFRAPRGGASPPKKWRRWQVGKMWVTT
jgi:hypothetical protein